MSKPMWGTAAAVGFLALLVPSAARAQFYVPPATSPFYRPVVSPYLNLARGGNPAINYYGLIRPQMQFAGSLQTLQQQVVASQATLAAEGNTLLTTGHPVLFMNYSHYFFNLGGGTTTTAAAIQPGVTPFYPNPLTAGNFGTGIIANPNRTGMAPMGPRPIR